MSRYLRVILLLTIGATMALAGSGLAQAATQTVQITRSTFTPTNTVVAPGDTVTWVNADDVDHQVVSNFGFTSPVLTPGQSYSHAFASAGSFPYKDGFYPAHTATINVRGKQPAGTVNINRSRFNPATETVEPGTTVTWTNVDSVDHQVVAADGSFTSPVLHAGQSYSKQFSTAGSFAYKDGFYPAHTGTIKVLPPLPAPPTAGEIGIWNNGFAPGLVTTTIGTTETWYNADRYKHQVVADDGSFTSPVLAPGQTFAYKFAFSGRYGYHDGLHANLKGTVVVAEGVSLAASQPAVVYSQQLVLSGQITSGRAGETVTLYENPDGSSSPTQVVATTITTTGGAFSFSVTPARNTSYAAQWKQTTSATVAVAVSPHMMFVPVAGSHFRTYQLTTQPGSTFAGKLARWQHLVNGQWVNGSTVQLNASGSATFKRPQLAGVYRLYLDSSQAGPLFAAGNSGTQHFRSNA
jgi:plastocyanin